MLMVQSAVCGVGELTDSLLMNGTGLISMQRLQYGLTLALLSTEKDGFLLKARL